MVKSVNNCQVRYNRYMNYLKYAYYDQNVPKSSKNQTLYKEFLTKTCYKNIRQSFQKMTLVNNNGLFYEKQA